MVLLFWIGAKWREDELPRPSPEHTGARRLGADP